MNPNEFAVAVLAPQMQKEIKTMVRILELIRKHGSASAISWVDLPNGIDDAEKFWAEFWEERYDMASLYHLEIQKSSQGELACPRQDGWKMDGFRLYRKGYDGNGNFVCHHIRDMTRQEVAIVTSLRGSAETRAWLHPKGLLNPMRQAMYDGWRGRS